MRCRTVVVALLFTCAFTNREPADERQDLPKGCNDLPSAPAAAAFGDAFLARGERLALIVPSAAIPAASNIVVNPRHPQMAGVTMAIIRDFAYDPRRRP